MTDLRTAAQQALKALQWHYRQGHSNTLGGFRLKIDEKALRELSAALAQQGEPVEPVAWLVMDESGYVQHAASWRDAAHEHINDAINEHDLVCARTWRVVPVYTSPPQRKPLTEEEIFKIENDIPDDVISDRAWTICLTRAVERAVWEKNHG